MALLFFCIWTALESGPREPQGPIKVYQVPFFREYWPWQDQTPHLGRNKHQNQEQNHETGFSSQGRQASAGRGASEHCQLARGCSFCPRTYCDVPAGGLDPAEGLAQGDATKRRWSLVGSHSVFSQVAWRVTSIVFAGDSWGLDREEARGRTA